MSRRLPGLALVLALLAAVSGCGSDDGVEENRIIGDTLTVYSSAPLSGPLAPVARDVVAAEKLALAEAGGKAGEFAVSYVSLDSADPESGRSEPGRLAANARRAVQTPNTVAYLGELEPGSSATSLPILNAGGILQVSPRDTQAGLTESGAPGEPDRFYPSGVENFARVVPAGDAQAEPLVAALRAADVRRLAVTGGDATPIGRRVADLAGEAGIDVVGRGARPDAVLVTGDAAEAERVLASAGAGVRVFGTDALALRPPARPGRLELTAVDPREDAAFRRRFAAEYGREPERQAVLGYRAMRLVLDAIRAAGPDADSRREVIERAMGLAGEPRAGFGRYRFGSGGLVSVGPPL